MTEDITGRVLNQIREDIAELRHHMDERFEAIDRRFEQVDRRLEQIDRRFEQVDRRLEHVDRRFDRNAEQLSSLIALMGVLAKNDDRVERRVEAIEAQLAGPAQG